MTVASKTKHFCRSIQIQSSIQKESSTIYLQISCFDSSFEQSIIRSMTNFFVLVCFLLPPLPGLLRDQVGSPLSHPGAAPPLSISRLVVPPLLCAMTRSFLFVLPNNDCRMYFSTLPGTGLRWLGPSYASGHEVHEIESAGSRNLPAHWFLWKAGPSLKNFPLFSLSLRCRFAWFLFYLPQPLPPPVKDLWSCKGQKVLCCWPYGKLLRWARQWSFKYSISSTTMDLLVLRLHQSTRA